MHSISISRNLWSPPSRRIHKQRRGLIGIGTYAKQNGLAAPGKIMTKSSEPVRVRTRTLDQIASALALFPELDS